ncbi:MAG: ATP-binding protein [Spirochaetales bacterium]|nr:ATP-binding protein [Spirochaetales bacterium]
MKETLKQIIAENQKGFNQRFIKRDLDIERIPRKATIVIGVRRCGKSTMLDVYAQSLIESGIPEDRICKLDFSDDRLVGLRNEAPSVIADAYYELFPENHNCKVYFFFDEIYHIKDWELFVNRLQTTENCEVNITGSSSRMLVEETSSELGGRKLGWELFCYSYREFLRSRGGNEAIGYTSDSRDRQLKMFNDYLLIGGFPEADMFRSETARNLFFQNTQNDIVYRDIILRHDVSKPMALKTMVILLFGMMGQMMSISKLYQRLMGMRVEISKPLVTEYLEYIKETFAVFLVPIRSNNQAVKATNDKKIYIADHAMAASVSGGLTRDVGLRMENIVFLHLRRKYKEVFYYRTGSGYEVDFAVGPWPEINLVQVCMDMSDSVTKERELRSLREAMRELKVRNSTVVTMDIEDSHEFDEGTVTVIPAWKYLLS